jgi:predicted dehydrogenase
MDVHRIALIGYGLAGSAFHAPLIAATQGLRLTHVVTSSPQRAAQAAQRYPQARIVAGTQHLWDSADEFDAVVVASPNDSHAPLAAAALELDRGVVVDKPLAASSADGQRLVDLATRTGNVLTVFQNRRWDGDFLTVRALAGDGSLGTVQRLESRFDRWRPTVDRSRWREDPSAALAGGLLFDLGSHLVDQAITLLGPVDSVYGEVLARRPGALVDDDVFVALQHRSGATSHLWASMLAAQLAPRFRVLGDRAAYVVGGLDPQEDQLRAGWSPLDSGFGVAPTSSWGLLGAGDEVAPTPTRDGRYLDFYQGFAAALSGGAPPPVDPAECVQVLRVIEAARKSSREHRVVALTVA